MSGADAAVKAGILIEALPYIRRWADRKVVIKCGGETLTDPDVLDAFATDVALLRFVGIRPVVVHGGGPQITEMMRRLGVEPRFIDGRRVTDAETMKIVKMVLVGDINKGLVSAISGHGAPAVGVSGEDAGMLKVRPIDPELGAVGEVERVDPQLLEDLIAAGHVPVVAPIGTGAAGDHNINADTAAGAIAASLGAAKLVFLTNVPGLYRDLGDAGSLISQTDGDHLRDLLASGTLSDGMVPKIDAAASALKAGVPQVHILDGRVRHALLLEIFTDEGIGTMVTP